MRGKLGKATESRPTHALNRYGDFETSVEYAPAESPVALFVSGSGSGVSACLQGCVDDAYSLRTAGLEF